jgi:hypothetical protein
VLDFVYKSRTDQIRSEPIPQLIFGLIYLLILTRFIWPIDLPLWAKIVVAVLALVALQFHRWSKLSSGSVFSPEFASGGRAVQLGDRRHRPACAAARGA